MSRENALLMKLSNDVEVYEIEVTKMGQNYCLVIITYLLSCHTFTPIEKHAIFFQIARFL